MRSKQKYNPHLGNNAKRRKRFAIGAVILLVIAAVAAVAVGLIYDSNRKSGDDTQGFLGGQLDRGKPITLLVMGDSTGFRPNYWVDQIAQSIAADYDRPVVSSRWNRDTLAYDAPTEVAAGEGEPVTIWNGSAPGEQPRYFQQHLDAVLEPVGVPDFVIINHGHNTGPDPALDISRLTNKVRTQFPEAPIGLTVQNPYLGHSVEISNTRAAEIRTWALQQRNFTVIDVDKAYRSSPDIDSLYVDDRHPSEAGSELWTQTVKTALGLR